MSKSIKKNFGYNLILTFCNYLFPLLTYPYVSRVLGVDRIGACNFVDGIINYFVLFSILGIGSYGVREIAKCRDNEVTRNKVFTNLIILNAIGTIVSVIVLIICTFTLPMFLPYKEFLLVGISKLVFNIFLIEWFFQGLQEFKYITIRSVIVRAIYVVSVFLLIHSKEDVLIYYLLTCSTIVLNALFNWTYSRKFRRFNFADVNIRPFITPVLVFGYYRILTSMYTSFNVVFLGFTSGDIEVGNFTTATKLYSIIMGVFTAFTTVMVPKVSELLAKGDIMRLTDMANKTFSMLTALSMPIIFFSLFCANDIILIMSGPGYEGAYTPFRIVIFLLLIIGSEQIVIQQFLMASTSNKSIFAVSTIGAIVGLLLNLLFTPRLGAIGAAISWGFSELSVLLAGVYNMKKHVGIHIDYIPLFRAGIWSFLYVIPLVIVNYINLDKWMNILTSGVLVLMTFVAINFKINRNELITSMVNDIFKKMRLNV